VVPLLSVAASSSFPLGRLCWILIQLAFVRNPLFLLDSHESEVETEDSERMKTSKEKTREKELLVISLFFEVSFSSLFYIFLYLTTTYRRHFRTRKPKAGR
jgi:nitrate/nitrite transporter NarK